MREEKFWVYMNVALSIAMLSTCGRRKVGCVLLDEDTVGLSIGYNGVPKGQAHCDDHRPCAGMHSVSGQGLELCEAIHAEQNAIAWCPRVQDVRYAICTTSPCIHCAKMLMNTGCEKLVFLEEYPDWADQVKRIWLRSKRSYERLDPEAVRAWRPE